MTDNPIEIQTLGALSQIDAGQWDACAGSVDGARGDDPFTSHRFLKALEDSASVGGQSGWQPQHLVARVGRQVIACAPMYLKSHSQGEYVFDHNWADAYARARGQYYPKLQIAVPFTPVTGRRLLARPGYGDIGRRALIDGAIQLTHEAGLSSLHITFCSRDEGSIGVDAGLLRRVGQQFHWVNHGYGDFDDFLNILSSRKRKNIRKERARANGFGGEIHLLNGDEIRPHHWDAFWRFYQDTGARKWGMPYLTRSFFEIIQQVLRDDIVLVMAKKDGEYIAGALNFVGKSTLYGRYWGCIEHHRDLHFELCYYRAIDYAIKHRLARVEAGAQGGHKLARGYLPVETTSLHWIRDLQFRRAVADFLRGEQRAVRQDIHVLTGYGPFRKMNPDDDLI